MFQTQEKDLQTIKTSSSIDLVESQQKNQEFEKIQKALSQNKFYDSESILSHVKTTQNVNGLWKKKISCSSSITNMVTNGPQLLSNSKEGNSILSFRTDNSVKNHFYSRLRKGVRKLNKTINVSFKKSFKQFKIIDLYKVIEASDENFKENKIEQNQFADIGHGKFFFMEDLKNRLFHFAEEENDSTEEAAIKIKKLIDDFSAFTKDYKRKSKKNRRYSPMGPDSVYRSIIKNQSHKNQSNQESMSEEPSVEKQIPLNSKHSRIELRKTHLRREQKLLDEKTQKISNNESRKEEKKTEQTTKIGQSKNKVIYKRFSEDQEEEAKNEQEELREQKLNHFAENILRTFKSYLSLQSFHSNAIGEELFQ